MSGAISPGVLAVETRIADGKAAVIAGSRIALAVDAGIDDDEGAAVLSAARSLQRETIKLVYTHGHADHVLGGTAFSGHDILARRGIARQMTEQLDAWAERSGEAPGSLAARLGWPTLVFDGEAAIDLGDRWVRLLDTPGHAPDALCVYDEAHGVLFGGDTVVTAILPAFSDGDGPTLERTLRTLARLDAEVLVPGHGVVVMGRDSVRTAIEWAADYLARCIAHVDAGRGSGVEELVASADYERFVGDQLPRERNRMAWRHEQTIRTLCARRDMDD